MIFQKDLARLPIGEMLKVTAYGLNHNSTESDRSRLDAMPVTFCVILALIVCFLAIHSQSLWIDETLTAYKDMQTSVQDWWGTMVGEKLSSNLQMPGYLFYSWAMARVLGTSEWALRFANVPWFIAGFATIIAAIRSTERIYVCLALLTSAFVWYYLDEARPYAMQIGSTLMIIGGLIGLQKQSPTDRASRKWFVCLGVGMVALSSSSLLGMLWAAAAIPAAWLLLSARGCFQLGRKFWLATLLTTAVLTFLALFYLWTIKVGARATNVADTTPLSIGFIFYEMLGFLGLGPNRQSLRHPSVKLLQPYIPFLVFFGASLFVPLVLGLKRFYKTQSNALLLIAAVLAPWIFILMAGFAMHFRVLGRHCSPLFVVGILLISLGLGAAFRGKSWPLKCACVLFLLLTLASSLSIRFSARHRNDDYRGAATFASQELSQGGTVWWNAAIEGARYYNVSGEKLHFVMNPTDDMIRALPAPTLVVESKPDIYDGKLVLANYLSTNHFRLETNLQSFRILHPVK